MSLNAPLSPGFRAILDSLASFGHERRKVFDAFVRFVACALACQTRETEYLDEARKWKAEEMRLFAEALGALVLEMESKPFEDVLGAFYLESALSQRGAQQGGEFHTPAPICELMARLTLGSSDLPPEGPITVCDPACGAGAMILALGKSVTPEIRRRLRVTAVDVSRTACDLTFINTTLWGIPCRVIHGNSLSRESWGAWCNIHYICPWLPLALRPETRPQGEPASSGEMKAAAEMGEAKQGLFGFAQESESGQ